MTLSARGRRNKGKVGERQTATDLREKFPWLSEGIKRGWQTRAGADDPDVIFPGYWFESKKLKRFTTAPLDQAISDSKGRGVPVAVIRPDRKKPVVMMLWSDFLVLLATTKEAQSVDTTDSVHPVRRQVLSGSTSTRWRVRLRAE